MSNVKDRGSEHYKALTPQPIEVMVPWVEQGMAYELSQVLKYVSRMSFVDEAKAKHDAEKAKHFIDLFLDRWFDQVPEGGLGPEVFDEPKDEVLSFDYTDARGNHSTRRLVDAKYNPTLKLVFGYDLNRQGIRAFKVERMGLAEYKGLLYGPPMLRYALPEDNDR